MVAKGVRGELLVVIEWDEVVLSCTGNGYRLYAATRKKKVESTRRAPGTSGRWKFIAKAFYRKDSDRVADDLAERHFVRAFIHTIRQTDVEGNERKRPGVKMTLKSFGSGCVSQLSTFGAQTRKVRLAVSVRLPHMDFRKQITSSPSALLALFTPTSRSHHRVQTSWFTGCNTRSLLQSICTQIGHWSSSDVIERSLLTGDTLPTYDSLRSDVVEQLFYVTPLICYAQTLKFVHDRLGEQSQLPRYRSTLCHHDRE